MSSVQLEHVGKTYPGGVEVIRDLNLVIKDQAFVVLVGPSGCGKSTILRMIAGLEDISSGELTIDGEVVNDVLPKDRDIAMVFQNYALYPHMTVYENMAFGLKMAKVPEKEIRQAVEEAACTLGIEALLDRKPKALSGGQRQRVALGRAMVRHPRVFLLDEPLSNLDAKLRDQMRAEIRKLHEKLQTTFVYVTHDQREAMTMGTCIVVLKDGIIQQADTPQKLYESPQNMFVAGFLGSPQMNFFTGQLLAENGKMYLQLAEGELPLSMEQSGQEALQPYINQEVVLGVRPEDLYDAALVEHKDDMPVMDMQVESIEMMGAEKYLYLNTAGTSAIACVKPQTAAVTGKNIQIALDAAKFHFFDKNTEQAIWQS